MKIIEKIDFKEIKLEEEYSKIAFENCDFSGREIHEVYFENCTFLRCNFTLTKFFNNLIDVQFTECKMTGVDFTSISRFANSFRFENSHLNYASFIRVKMRESHFVDCNLTESYFDDADIASSVFDNCDLTKASFHGTNLEKVDFSTAYNFAINPTVNKLKKTIFSENELKGLVAHLNIIIK